MAREALHEIDVGAQPAEMRRHVQRDVHEAAPGVLDAQVGQLRKHLQHAAADARDQVARRHARVAVAAAEQQAVVRAQAEVVEDEVGVRCGAAPRQQRLRARRRHGLGRQQVGAHRHDARADLGGDGVAVLAQVYVARQHDEVAGALALRRLHHRLAPALHHEHRRVLEDARARALRRRRQPQAVPQRMQVAGAGVEHGGVEARAVHPSAHLAGADPLQRIVVGRLHVVHPAAQLPRLARAGGQVQVAGLPVAIDAVAADALLQQPHAVHRHVPGAARVLAAELALDRLLAVAAVAHDRLAAIAPGSAPARIGALQHHRLDAVFLGQMIGCGESGIAAADDRDIGLDIAFERRVFRRRRRDRSAPPARHRRAYVERGGVIEVFHQRIM